MSAAVGLIMMALVLASCGPDASAATLFVAPGGGGGGCSQQAPCGSVDRAFDLAGPGDVVEVAGGVYGSQEVSGDKGSSTPVTVRVAAGQTMVVNGAFEVFADHVRVVGPIRGASRFDVDDPDQSNPIVDVVVEDVQAGPSLVENARGLVVRNSSFGGVNGRKPLQTGAWPTSHGVTFDGVLFHDAAPTDPGQHLECLTISGVQGITVRNSVFRRCGYFGILAGNGLFAGGAAGPRDLVLENNVFEVTLCWANAGGCPPSGGEDSNPNTGAAPYSLMFGADPFVNVAVRNNVFQTEPSVDKPSYTNARFVGNVGVHGRCVPGLTYRHNVFTTRTCGTGDRRAPRVLRTFDSNWRLLPGSPAIGAADPDDVPATDRDGHARDADPDAGPDEHGTSGSTRGTEPIGFRTPLRMRVRLRRTRRGPVLVVRLSAPARVSARIQRKRRAGFRGVRGVRRLRARRVPAGRTRIRLGRLPRGRYRMNVVATPVTGLKRHRTVRFRVAGRR
jgi:hypothetical protein